MINLAALLLQKKSRGLLLSNPYSDQSLRLGGLFYCIFIGHYRLWKCHSSLTPWVCLGFVPILLVPHIISLPLNMKRLIPIVIKIGAFVISTGRPRSGLKWRDLAANEKQV